MRLRFDRRDVDVLNVGKVPDQRVELALECKDLGIVQLQSRQTSDVSDFVYGDGHGGKFSTGADSPKLKGPSYSVVSGVVAILGVFALVIRWLQPLVPPPSENELAKESSDYLRAARFQSIPWKRPGPVAFGEARRTQKNILLVVGASWSKAARSFDRTVLAEPEVQEHLRRSYVCVRVDASEEPWWMQAYLPLSRVAAPGFDPGFQVWVLDPEAQLVGFVEVPTGLGQLDSGEFLRLLRQVREQEESMIAGEGAQPTPGTVQRLDLLKLRQTQPVEPPTVREYASALVREADFDTGGFAEGLRLTVRPQPYINLFLGGRTEEGKAYLDKVLSSSVVDWLDGGFFRGAAGDDWRDVEYDKLAIQNVEMVHTLALASAITGDHFYAEIAQHFAESLIEAFLVGSSVVTAKVGDEDALGGSARASIAASEVRTILGSGELDVAERRFARDFLGLDRPENTRMTLRLDDPRAVFSDKKKQFLAVRGKLLGSRIGTIRRSTDPPNLEVAGIFAARILETARLIGSKELERKGLTISDSLSAFIDPSPRQTLRSTDDYLGAYLSVADACLADYLLTGRSPSFQLGLGTLNRSRELFASSQSGVWTTLSSAGEGEMPPDTTVSEVLDNVGESCEARAVRLLFMYGIVSGGEAGEKLVQESGQKRIAYGGLVSSLGILGAGFMNAVAVSRNPYALVTGPRAVEEASALSRVAPRSLVAPVAGFDHPSLLGKPAGIYVGREGMLTGPLSKDRAASLLNSVP